MNELVTVSADGLQVLDTVRPPVRPVLAVMDLKPPARPTLRTAPSMLLHGLAAVDGKYAVYQGTECHEISAAHRPHHQPFTLKSPYCT
jgi:hypothetical protein